MVLLFVQGLSLELIIAVVNIAVVASYGVMIDVWIAAFSRNILALAGQFSVNIELASGFCMFLDNHAISYHRSQFSGTQLCQNHFGFLSSYKNK